MSWLKGLLHPTRASHDDLERQAADELERLTADARGPSDRDVDLDRAEEPPAPARRPASRTRQR